VTRTAWGCGIPPPSKFFYDFKNSFAEKIEENFAILSQITANLCQKVIVTLVSRQKRQFLQKIGQNHRTL
jgi:hypothetical protein